MSVFMSDAAVNKNTIKFIINNNQNNEMVVPYDEVATRLFVPFRVFFFFFIYQPVNYLRIIITFLKLSRKKE